jgi:hypothetical protein
LMKARNLLTSMLTCMPRSSSELRLLNTHKNYTILVWAQLAYLCVDLNAQEGLWTVVDEGTQLAYLYVDLNA